jgi:LysR family glycine cleavage system transcriptional activator
VSLTESGHRYQDVARLALRTLADFPLPNKITKNQLFVKITFPPTFARYMFLPRLKEFTCQHPEIEIELFLFVPLYDLSLSESDVEVRFGAGEYPNLVTKKTFHRTCLCSCLPRIFAIDSIRQSTRRLVPRQAFAFGIRTLATLV